MTDFLKSSNDFQQWKRAAEYIDSLLAEAVQNFQGLPPAGVFDRVKEALNRADAERWNNERFLYTYAHLDFDALIALAAERPALWPVLFNSKACFGPVEDLQKVYQACMDRGIKLGLDTALFYASTVTALCPGLKTSGCYDSAEQLLKWGANANAGFDRYSNGSGYFYRAVSDCGVDMGKLYARYGLTQQVMVSMMQTSQGAGNTPLYRKFREIYWEYARYSVADAETLVENKEIDPSKACQLRIIFNFASCRVNEVYEWSVAGRQPVVREFTFDDYGSVAVETARQKLIELGGKPSEGMMKLMGKDSFGKQPKR